MSVLDHKKEGVVLSLFVSVTRHLFVLSSVSIGALGTTGKLFVS